MLYFGSSGCLCLEFVDQAVDCSVGKAVSLKHLVPVRIHAGVGARALVEHPVGRHARVLPCGFSMPRRNTGDDGVSKRGSI
jgi:hypothetical protein